MKLATYLENEHVTVRDFAHRIGVTAEAVRLYLAGARHPRPKIMQAIHRETRGAVTPNDFMEASHPSGEAA